MSFSEISGKSFLSGYQACKSHPSNISLVHEEERSSNRGHGDGEAESNIELIRGAYSLKGIKIKVKVKASEEQAEKVKRCLNLAMRYCHVSRSIE